ncbi:MAG: nucleotidyltransferase family protein, partial [Oscillospiraceae bacterium]|nr:nucleotidyltransferase family protein [Oscillospiraceae bacterium]
MNTVEMIFLKSVRCALSGEILKDADDISPSQWKSVFSMAQMHRVLPLVLDAVYSCPGVKALDGENGNLFRKRAREIVLLQTMRTEKFLQIYDRLIDGGVSPILIKGLLCRSLYPNPDCRPSGDEDILICPQETEKAVDIISQMDMQAKDIPYDHNLSADNVDEIAFYGTDNPLHLELHQRLFSSRSETFSTMNALFSHCFEEKITQTIHGRDIYTLSHTDNMLYMMLHCFKHFIHSGFGIRQVCDITLYANQYGHLIDWGK